MDPCGYPAVYHPPLHLCRLNHIPWHLERPGCGFHALAQTRISPVTLQTFLDLGELSQALQAHAEGLCQQIHTDSLTDCCQILQHRLLSLPRHDPKESPCRLREDSSINTPSSDSAEGFPQKIYEAVRLASLLYSLHVIYPFPRSKTVVRRQLLPALEKALHEVDVPSLVGEMREVLLWSTFVGAIAALDESPPRDWLASHALKLLYLNRVSDFEHLKEVLRSMAWLDSACNPGGMRVWKGFQEAGLSPKGRRKMS